MLGCLGTSLFRNVNFSRFRERRTVPNLPLRPIVPCVETNGSKCERRCRRVCKHLAPTAMASPPASLASPPRHRRSGTCLLVARGGGRGEGDVNGLFQWGGRWHLMQQWHARPAASHE